MKVVVTKEREGGLRENNGKNGSLKKETCSKFDG
jgi:hypothetical protein